MAGGNSMPTKVQLQWRGVSGISLLGKGIQGWLFGWKADQTDALCKH